MANNLGEDISGRYVLIQKSWFEDQNMAADVRERVFLAGGGFGCSPHTRGNAVVGEFVIDGEQIRVEGYDLETRFATDEEVAAAKAERARREGNA